MRSSKLATSLLVALGLSTCTLGSVRAQDFEQVEIETIPVAENVYMLVGEGGNIGVSAGEDGTFLIDDQFAPLTDKIRAAVAEISDRPIRFLLNTHWHFDHTGGNENLGEAGVVILAHNNVRQRMSTGQFIEALNMQIPAAPPEALPIITFEDGVTFHINGDTIHAIHVDPAHTDGDTFLHWANADVIHTGDLYFSDGYPFIDTSSGGSIDGMIAATERILAMADENTKIIPGHGPLSNREELMAYRNMLIAVRGRTMAAIAMGMSLEEFIASNPTAELDEAWGNGFLTPEQFQTIVYSDLSEAMSESVMPHSHETMPHSHETMPHSH